MADEAAAAESGAGELERAVCLGEHVAHLIRAGEGRAVCGAAPVVRLSRMDPDWQTAWLVQAVAYELCGSCAPALASP